MDQHLKLPQRSRYSHSQQPSFYFLPRRRRILLPDSLPLLDFQVRVLHEALLLLSRIHHQCALDAILQIINQESLLRYHLVRAIPADGLDRNLAGDAAHHRQNRSFHLQQRCPPS